MTHVSFTFERLAPQTRCVWCSPDTSPHYALSVVHWSRDRAAVICEASDAYRFAELLEKVAGQSAPSGAPELSAHERGK